MKKRGLGRGLQAILSAPSIQEIQEVAIPVANLGELPVDQLQRGRYQPRREMDEEALQHLASSIKVQGVLQPIIVRKILDGRYEIVAGERRWRAAQLAGLAQVPVVIKEIPDETAMAIGLVENIQRENLNAIEEAHALQRLLDEFEMTHQEVAESVGRSRTAVSNLLRLLNLAEQVQTLLVQGDLEMGHARALLALPVEKQWSVAQQVVEKRLSVRDTEALVKKLQQPGSVTPKIKAIHPQVAKLQALFSQHLKAKVTIQGTPRKGKVVIEYMNPKELEGLVAYFQH
jgi:ParB family chromosome partitioning protein